MDVVDNYRLNLGNSEFIPIVTGGMGVDISTAELALEVCRLGGIGHISDAMVQLVSDKKFRTKYTQNKAAKYEHVVDSFDKTEVKFILDDLYQAQLKHVQNTIEQKKGTGAIFVNIMEKLTMAAPIETLEMRLKGALDGGADGITLSAGLHMHSLKLLEQHPRFRDAKIGIIVSSTRALKIFLRGAQRVNRLPDFIVVEGPLAGGHLGFGEDWKEYQLSNIATDVIAYLKDNDLNIPAVVAGGVFTGSDAVGFLKAGASAVQVATRFTITKECGLPKEAKQKYFEAQENDVAVTTLSPTGYLLRMLKTSPCHSTATRPHCEALGYCLEKDATCQYLSAYQKEAGDKMNGNLPVKDKICLCFHFGKYNCYTCGHFVYRLKDTTHKNTDGSYQLLSAEHVFKDYQYSKDGQIALPNKED